MPDAAVGARGSRSRRGSPGRREGAAPPRARARRRGGAGRGRSRGRRPRRSEAPSGPRPCRAASRRSRSPPRRRARERGPRTTTAERIWKNAVAIRSAVSIPSRVIIRSVKAKTPQKARRVGSRARARLDAALDVRLQVRRDALHVDEQAADECRGGERQDALPERLIAAFEKRKPAAAQVTTRDRDRGVDGARERSRGPSASRYESVRATIRNASIPSRSAMVNPCHMAFWPSLPPRA